MRTLLTVTALMLLLAIAACGGDNDTAPAATDGSPAATTRRSPAGPSLNLAGTPKTDGATVEKTEGRTVTRIPSSSCIETTVTPLVIGEYAVFATHLKTPKPDDPYGNVSDCHDDGAKPGLYAVSLVSGEAYTLMEANAEGSPAFGAGMIIQPLLGSGNVAFWREGKATVADKLSAGIDSAGLWDERESVFVAGTVNSPFEQCQAPVNPDCGAVIALADTGDLLQRIDRNNGMRAWVTGGVTGDGQRYYIGTGSGQDGESAPGWAPGCQVLALSKKLEIVDGYDDGLQGCTSIGKLESAVVGEVPIAGDAMWVQYVGSTNEGPWSPIVLLSRSDLHVVCRTEIAAAPWQPTALYYQAPVIDAEGNAWVVLKTSDNGNNAAIIRIGPDCARQILVNTTAARASTPTLADDKYILVAWDGQLHVIDRVTGDTHDYDLGEDESVIGGAVVSDYGVTVVGESGTVTTFTNTGIKGYGGDPWPRFRKDNFGSATAD